MSTKGLKRYTNGIENRMFVPGTEPEGFYLGVSEEYKNKNSSSHKGKPAWNKGLTKETDERVAKYSKPRTEEQRKNYSDSTRKSWTEDDYRNNHLKSMNTEDYRNKISNSSKVMWSTAGFKERQLELIQLGKQEKGAFKKQSEKMKEVWKTSEYRNKRLKTFKLNNSFNKSNPEEEYYNQLITLYGKDGVVRQYSDNRYPFNCDFYIPSEDLFIECNYHWTHGGHPFDSNDKDDIKLLEDWKKKSDYSHYYKNAIYTWTDLDVRKQNIAKLNNLNYKVIY